MEQFISAEGRVTPSCAKSHISYSFFVPKGHDKINIYFHYGPKRLDDRNLSKELIHNGMKKYEGSVEDPDNWEQYLPLMNHITLSVDDPSHFRGATHRHDSELDLSISENQASPGLTPGNIQSGQWKVTLDLHAVVTQNCEYRLEVWGVNSE